MKDQPDNFNLLVKPWIPVLYTNGKTDRIGIRQALTEAGRIRQIAASNPMDRVALLRFLLAVLYWCRGNPPSGRLAGSGHSFPVDGFEKLDEHKDCFNLLGDGKRFYQDPRAERSRPSTDLLQEIPTGNNFWHFRHSTDKTDGLCPACCAMGLLRLPLFSVSGLPDLKAGINGTPPIYVVPCGVSLLDTLCANWVTCMQPGDPSWVRPDLRPTSGEDVPLLIGLTLLSRRVWLHEPSGPPSRCIGCGAIETALIKTCEFQSAGTQENELWTDPHVLYSVQSPRKASKAPDLTAAGKFRMDRPWPNLLASIVETSRFVTVSRPLSLQVIGFATDQAKNIDVWERTFKVLSASSILESATSLLMHWHKEGGRLEKEIQKIVRSESAGAATLAALRPQVEDRVSEMAEGLLAGGDDVWARATSEYRPMMTMVAKSLSPGVTTAALQRQNQIAELAPEMRTEPKPVKKTRRNKGDGS